AAGLQGSLLPGLSTSGFGQMPTILKPPTPLTVNSYQDIASAVGVAGPLGQQLNSAGIGAVFRLVDRLSESQAARLLGHGLRDIDELGELLKCATESNIANSGTAPPPTDP